MLLAIQWKYKRMQWSTTPNYLAYCGQESVDKVKAIQKNQKTAESRNPPLSQKRLQIKINYSSVPYPPVAPICFVCQVKDVLFYFSVKGFYGQVSISDTVREMQYPRITGLVLLPAKAEKWWTHVPHYIFLSPL